MTPLPKAAPLLRTFLLDFYGGLTRGGSLLFCSWRYRFQHKSLPTQTACSADLLIHVHMKGETRFFPHLAPRASNMSHAPPYRPCTGRNDCCCRELPRWSWWRSPSCPEKLWEWCWNRLTHSVKNERMQYHFIYDFDWSTVIWCWWWYVCLACYTF